MNFDKIINDYAQSHGVAPLAFDQKGICHFLINDSVAVSLEKTLDDKGFFLYSILGKIPAEHELAYALAALEGNLFGKETRLSTIGYDPHTRNLIISRYFDGFHTGQNELVEGFDEFLQVYAYWINKLKKIS